MTAVSSPRGGVKRAARLLRRQVPNAIGTLAMGLFWLLVTIGVILGVVVVVLTALATIRFLWSQL